MKQNIFIILIIYGKYIEISKVDIIPKIKSQCYIYIFIISMIQIVNLNEWKSADSNQNFYKFKKCLFF